MRRLLICFLGALLLAASLCILVGAESAEALSSPEDTRGEWQAYIEDKLWPTVASIGTSIFGIYLMVSPVLSRMNKSSGVLGGVSKSFAEALAELKKAREQHGEDEERIAAMEEALELQKQLLARSDERFGKLCRVFALAWGADEKMVKSGAAREMMKVVEEYVAAEE